MYLTDLSFDYWRRDLTHQFRSPSISLCLLILILPLYWMLYAPTQIVILCYYFWHHLVCIKILSQKLSCFLHKPNYDVISSVYITPWLIIRPDVSLVDSMYHASFINQFVHYLLLSYLQMISFLNFSLRWCFNRLVHLSFVFLCLHDCQLPLFCNTSYCNLKKNAQSRSHHIYTM